MTRGSLIGSLLLFGASLFLASTDVFATSLRGRVVDQFERPVAHVVVALSGMSAGDPLSMALPYRAVRTGADGRFRISVPRAKAPAVLSVTTDRGYASRTLEDVAKAGDVELRLASCASPTTIALVPGNARPGEKLASAVEVPLRSFTTPPGQYVLALANGVTKTCLPEGEYVAQVDSRSYRIGPSMVLAESGQQERIEFWETKPGAACELAAARPDLVAISDRASWAALNAAWRPYRVVAIGENSHGASNGLGLVEQIIRSGALDRSVTLLAVETDAYRARRINAALLGNRQDEIERELRQIPDWIFPTREFQALLLALLDRNAQGGPSQRTELIGLDVVLPYFAHENLMEKLEKSLPELHARYASSLKEFSLPGAQLEEILDSALSDRLASALGRLMVDLKAKVNTVGDLAELEEDIEYLATYLRWKKAPDPGVARDEGMAERLLKALAREPQQRALLLAHNGHVTRHSPPQRPTLGGLLQKSLGDRYHPVATLYGGGRVRAFDEAGKLDAQAILEMSAFSSRTAEAMLARVSPGDFYLAIGSVRDDRKTSHCFDGALLWQNLGAFYAPRTGATQVYPATLAGSFGALLYFPQARPTIPLAKAQ